ncbi:MAG TPA: EAL domain-containing protein [Chloroflexota bacterium]|nr:EAL domain-containing protein [Chloroflexota bacterium]
MSLGEKKLAFWRQGPDDEALREKLYSAERRIAVIRLGIIALNTATYFALFDRSQGIEWLAWAIIAIAWAYGIWVALLEPYRKMAFLMGAVFTAADDMALITLWLLATGGYDSPYYMLWYASIVSLAFRYDYRRTVIAAVVDSVLYVGLLGFLGQLMAHPLEVILRVGYVFVVGLIGAEAAREAYNQVRLRLALRDEVRLLKAGEARLEYQSMHDALTGLPNRLLLHERLQSAVASGAHDGSMAALLLLDLDYFKEVNDTFGHEWGDRLLQAVAQRLKASVRDSDMVARLGGDEFAIVLSALQRAADTEIVAAKVLASLERPFEIGGQSLSVRGSIGIALSPRHGTELDELMRRADAAMYTAKEHRNSYATYDEHTSDVSTERLRLTTDLQRALETEQLVLYFQPQVDFSGEAGVAVEALVRWRHPTLGVLEPERFIGLAERAGIVQQLTDWTVDSALKQAHAWAEAGRPVQLALEIPARTLEDERLPQRIQAALSRWQIAPEQLTLEIAESTLVTHAGRALRQLDRLSGAGLGLSLTQFGAGQSALGNLKELPLTQLRLDRMFLADMPRDERSEAMVRSLVGLAHNLGLELVADGIDDEAVWRRLQVMGCDRGQGYYLGKPMEIEQLEEWLATSPWAAHRRPARPRRLPRRLEVARA